MIIWFHVWTLKLYLKMRWFLSISYTRANPQIILTFQFIQTKCIHQFNYWLLWLNAKWLTNNKWNTHRSVRPERGRGSKAKLNKTKYFFGFPCLVHCDAIKSKKKSQNKKRNYKKQKRAWSELNDFAQELLVFLCLCGASKIIIMYIISSSILEQLRHCIGRKKINLFQYASDFSYAIHSLLRDMERSAPISMMHKFEKREEKTKK